MREERGGASDSSAELPRSGLIGAASAGFHPSKREEKVVATQLKVGLAGLGAASRQVAPGFFRVPGVTFTAVADVRKDEVAQWERKFGVEGFHSVGDMAKQGDVDVVYIATPNHLHADHSLSVAEQGKHVICEKPMAITMEESHKMVEAVEKNGVRYIQGHSKIYRPSIRKMGEVIASGRLGPVHTINTWNYNDWLRRPWPLWSLQEEHGGGVVYRQGPHQIDTVRYLAGGWVKSVRAMTGRHNPYFDIAGNYSAWLEFESGAVVMAHFNGYGYFDSSELTWGIGEGGGVASDQKLYGPRRVQKEPVPEDEKYAMEEYSLDRLDLNGERQPANQDFFGITIVSCECGDLRVNPHGLYIYTDNGREELEMPARATYRGGAELLELQEALEQNRPTFPGADFGRATLEVCLGIYQSSREHREISMEYQSPSPIQVPAGVAG